MIRSLPHSLEPDKCKKIMDIFLHHPVNLLFEFLDLICFLLDICLCVKILDFLSIRVLSYTNTCCKL